MDMDTNTSARKVEGDGRAGRQIARFHLEIDPEGLKQVVASGQVMEFAATMASQAAAHITSQIVDRLAEAAVGQTSDGVGASAAFIFEGGDFGTVPPIPGWGIVRLDRFQSMLQRFASRAEMAAAG